MSAAGVVDLVAVARDVAAGITAGAGGVVLDANVKEAARGRILAMPQQERAALVEHLVAVTARLLVETGGSRDDKELPAVDDIIDLAALCAWEEGRAGDAVVDVIQEKLARQLVAGTGETTPVRAPKPDEPKATVHRIPVRV